MTAVYKTYYCDPHDILKDMIADKTFKHAFNYIPYQKFDKDGSQWYENLMSRDWAFYQAVCFVLYLHLSADAVASTEHHCGR
jgi:hypothetical protein